MSRPPIFTDIGLDAALEMAKRTGKLVLVAAKRESSEPCELMDRTTWAHDDVVAAVREHAIAIQVDVHEDHDAIKHLRVLGLPCTIAFQDGREIDRVTGALEPKALIDWLEALKQGETSADKALAEKPADIRGRLNLASKLLNAKRFDEALAEYTWLWENVPVEGPPVVSTRHGELVYEIKHLVELHPPARVAFSALRDRAAPAGTGKLDGATLHDWFSLCAALGTSDEIFEWYETVGKTLDADEAAQELLEKELAGKYIATERWADAGRLFKDPVRHLRKFWEQGVDMQRLIGAQAPPEMIAQLRAATLSDLRAMTRQLVRCVSAAGRLEVVEDLRREMPKIDPSPEMAAALAAKD